MMKGPRDRMLREIEVAVTRINFRHTKLDASRAVTKLVAAARLICFRGQVRPLAVESVRPWLRRFYGAHLTPAQCGSIVDLLPEYVDPLMPDDPLASVAPFAEKRRIDAKLLVLLCACLGDIDCAMAEPPLRRRPQSAPPKRTTAKKKKRCKRITTRSEDDEVGTLVILLVKLLAAALHHEPGSLGVFPTGTIAATALKNVIECVFRLPLSPREILVLRVVILSGAAAMDHDDVVYHQKNSSIEREGDAPKDLGRVSGRAIVRLMHELGNYGLRGSPMILGGRIAVALRRLVRLGISAALVRTIRALGQSHLVDNAVEDLRILERNVSLAAIKLSLVDDPRDRSQKLNVIEKALRTMCRAFFAHRRTEQRISVRRRRRSLASVAHEKPTHEHRKTLVSGLCQDLIVAHRQQVQRTVLGKSGTLKSSFELHRLEQSQRSHARHCTCCNGPPHVVSSQPEDSLLRFVIAQQQQQQQSLAAPAPAGPLLLRGEPSMTTIGFSTTDGGTTVPHRHHHHHETQEAACIITRAVATAACVSLRRRLSRGRTEWQGRLERRAEGNLKKAMGRWQKSRALTLRLASVTEEMRLEAQKVIERAIHRYIRKRRARVLYEARRRRRLIALRSANATPSERGTAASCIQAKARAIRVRFRSRELLAAREDVRVLRLDVLRASDVLVADSKKGSSDPLCYVTAQLGPRGGYAPEGAGPSTVVRSQIASAYASFKSPDQTRLWLPPTIRARDYGKFEALPFGYLVFGGQTPCVDETLNPVWDTSFVVPGVDPESTIALTVVDIDAVGKDDLLGQAVIDLKAILRKADDRVLNSMTPGHDEYTVHPPQKTRRSRLSFDANSDSPPSSRRILLADVGMDLGEQAIPVLDTSRTQRQFEVIEAETTRGRVDYRIWVAPRSLSLASYLEERLARNSMVAFWKTSWCVLGFDQLLAFNSRGDAEPRFAVAVDHLDTVDVIKETDDDLMFAFQVAGGIRHVFRVPEIGYPNQEQLLHAWVRRLRRASPRIPTNEFAPSDCSHVHYCRR